MDKAKKPYMGMCVGGPRAGQIIECEEPQFCAKVMSQPDFFSLNPHLGEPKNDLVQTVWYEFQPWGMGELKAGVWVVSGRSPIDTFNELLAVYADRQKDLQDGK